MVPLEIHSEVKLKTQELDHTVLPTRAVLVATNFVYAPVAAHHLRTIQRVLLTECGGGRWKR